jgi:regulator of protease activity HflC (stomatin/prohibitin superfamily)
MMRERERNGVPGVGLALLFIAAGIALGWLGITSAIAQRPVPAVAGGLGIIALVILSFGFFVVAPNQGKVLQFFGSYAGTARTPGLRWANPFYTKRKISLRIRNFETAKLKVNDNRGNPVEIAAVVVWKVVDTAEAAFQVDDYENYVHVQSEAALRAMAMNYPYDPHVAGEVSLTSHTSEISDRLKGEIQERLAKAGVEVIETRMSHMAYAPEIASAMLRKQQAGAVVAARQKIVEGAVGMVENALQMLSEKNIIALDDERKASMVSNLLVVLCSEHSTQPVVNTGTLYH